MPSKLVLTALLTAGLATSTFAGYFGYGLTAPGSYSNTVTTTATTSVVQQLQGTQNQSAITNDGPLGDFNISGIGYGYHTGNVAAGSYSVALTQAGGGYTAITMSW